MLNSAHEGYSYQDFLCVYFLLDQIIKEKHSSITIDVKQYKEDKFDDLTIIDSNWCFKKQIKYSNPSHDHKLSKPDISSDGTYSLPLDELFQAWQSPANRSNLELRLCLAWNNPTDELMDVLNEISDKDYSFNEKQTTIFQINADKLWPIDDTPLSSWRRFKEFAKSIDRCEFVKFCKCLVIETQFPKFSLNLNQPNALENILLDMTAKIGIGLYPNDHLSREDFILRVANLITRSRTNGETIKVDGVLKYLCIITDYGSIEQLFPVDLNKKIPLENKVSTIFQQLKDKHKVLITGEPGSGKSWLINDILEHSDNNGIHIIKHYCYTSISDDNYFNRIKTDVFYGNLIADILSHFPELKEFKETMFASSLDEINNLLTKIAYPTILLIDGLDHIDRIAESNKSLSLEQVNIIEQISKLNYNKHISILIFSQPVASIIQKLNQFEHIKISSWQEREINTYLRKLKLENFVLGERYLSALLLTKSSGNPLYLNYIIEEIKNLPHDSILQVIEELPLYNSNMEQYYNFLLSKLDQVTTIPQILSLVNFNLSCEDLKGITGQGKNVEHSLIKLSPILKHNVSDDGYIIYHESFRRFIHEFFITQEIEINNVYQTIFNWFEKKGVFEFHKAYRNYFSLAYNSRNIQKISKLINQDFIYQSIYFGNNWDDIIKNYNIIRNSISEFHEIAIVFEMKKILSLLEDQYSQIFYKYIELYGLIFGYSKVKQLLMHDSQTALSCRSCLEACYLCYKYGETAPWHEYIKLLRLEESFELSDIIHFVRYHLVFKNLFKLSMLINCFCVENDQDALNLIFEEIINFPDKDYCHGIISNHPILMQLNTIQYVYDNSQDLLTLAQKILLFENIFDKEKIVLDSFITQLVIQINNSQLISNLIQLFKNRNWFSNWIIFLIKILQIQNSKLSIDDEQVVKAFNFLINEPNDIKKPRIIDLYYIKDIIYNSIVDGLALCEHPDTYDKILDILFSINNFAFNVAGLFNLICSVEKNDFRLSILTRLEKLFYLQQNNSTYHDELLEYSFTLAKYFAIAKEQLKAKYFYELGIRYLLAYTQRKDISAEDIFDAFETFYGVDNQLGIDHITKLKSIADSIDLHTDGKSTSRFQIEWFEKFFKINKLNGSLFLLSQLLNSRYDHRLEDCLNFTIQQTKYDVSPLIICLLYQTCILDADEGNILEHIEVAYEVSDSIQLNLNQSLISAKCQIERNDDFTPEFKQRVLQIVNQQELPDFVKPSIKPKYQNGYRQANITKIDEIISSLHNSFEIRKQFMDMDLNEITEYIITAKSNLNHIQPLIYYFDEFIGKNNQLTNELKKFIICILDRRDRYSDHGNKEYDIFDEIFVKHQNIYGYYLIAKFVFSKDGWLHCLVDQNSFEQAYLINPKNAIKYLYELIPYNLSLDKYYRSITSNLIFALSKINFKSEVNNIYKASFDYMMSRFPSLALIDSRNQIFNDLEMGIEEIFICLFLSRFRLCTTLRVQVVFSGVLTLLKQYPDCMIKPIKWFILNKTKFESSVFAGVLQLLHDYCLENSEYRFQFENELKKIYPTNYFIIDYIIEDLFNLEKINPIFIEKNIINIPISNAEAGYIKRRWNSFHPRYHLIDYNGLDMYNIMSKLKLAKKYRNGLKPDYFYNRSHEISSNHIIISDLLLELVNTELYNDFKISDNQNDVYSSIRINTEILFAQTNSLNLRPNDLPDDSGKFQPIKICAENKKWIRLGHFEVLSEINNNRKINKTDYYGGIIFPKDSFVNIFPFANTIQAAKIFTRFNSEYQLDNAIIFPDISFEQSQLEATRILWLNPTIVSLLDLNVCTPDKGLFATNKSGEVVLKYNCWSSNYYASEGYDSMDHEIPKYLGAELIIEEHYFQKICEMYKVNPTYHIISSDMLI